MGLEEGEGSVQPACLRDLQVCNPLLRRSLLVLQLSHGRHLVLRRDVLRVRGDGQGPVQALPHVQVLQQVENGPLLALVDDVRIAAPVHDGVRGHPRGEECLAEEVVGDSYIEPVDALSKGLERAGGCMDTVVARVRTPLETKPFPLLVDHLANGAVLGGPGIGGAKDLAAEVLPREELRIPLGLQEVDGPFRCRVLCAHVHVESVDDVERAYPPAVEAPAKLDQVRAPLQHRPPRAKVLGRDAELYRGVRGVEDRALLQRGVPGEAEAALEVVLGLGLQSQLGGLQPHGLFSNGSVVPVNQLVLVDLLRIDLAL
mmetsp:Transcript_43846/g.125010  ORF Transcript_43846/g.125010 Transcript_43846/m.125010 type:complete len:315 (+) Transcript_43846:415-1359(+)